MEEDKFTNISVKESTRELLKTMGTKSDSYDSIILRTIQCYKKHCEDQK